MILASAQTRVKQGNIESSLNDHYNLIDLASRNQADLIVFPEMSITGYEREKALDLAFTEKDSRLDVLRQLSAEKQMILIANLNDTDSGLLTVENVDNTWTGKKLKYEYNRTQHQGTGF
ncbi:MAG: hypothetical protein LBK22_07175 [Tannerella sp.]|jgi:predicted amidohydrolase|nr:hypothetical protein [Tannerella sp.]